jgi:hypothetical protein
MKLIKDKVVVVNPHAIGKLDGIIDKSPIAIVHHEVKDIRVG